MITTFMNLILKVLQCNKKPRTFFTMCENRLGHTKLEWAKKPEPIPKVQVFNPGMITIDDSNPGKSKKTADSLQNQRFRGPSVEIRTQGLLNPIQARYQTSPHPEIFGRRVTITRRLAYNITLQTELQELF